MYNIEGRRVAQLWCLRSPNECREESTKDFTGLVHDQQLLTAFVLIAGTTWCGMGLPYQTFIQVLGCACTFALGFEPWQVKLHVHAPTATFFFPLILRYPVIRLCSYTLQSCNAANIYNGEAFQCRCRTAMPQHCIHYGHPHAAVAATSLMVLVTAPQSGPHCCCCCCTVMPWCLIHPGVLQLLRLLPHRRWCVQRCCRAGVTAGAAAAP